MPSCMEQAGQGRREGGEDQPQTPPEYRGGLGDEGIANLKSFVDAGGTVVALNKASQVYARKDAPVNDVLDGVAARDFYVPGSILQVSVDTNDPLGFGSAPTMPIFFELSPAFKPSGDSAHAVATYTNDQPLMSGWLLGGKYLSGAAALVEQKQGRGQIVLFGFRPQYRGQSEGTYKLFYNALLLGGSTATTLGGQ